MNVIEILKNDKFFKSNIRFATFITSMVIVYSAWYNLDRRVSQLEWQLNKEVEVTLEPIPEPKSKPAHDDRSSILYNNRTMIKMDKDDIECLAKNIYHEARFEPYVGQIAVAQVTFNRVLDGKWGDTICKVVYARKQFSWTLNKKLRESEPKGNKWKAALHYAKMFQYGVRVKDLDHAKWYHANYISPKWRTDFRHVSTLGRHIFYAKAH